jgi:hypothetical protein
MREELTVYARVTFVGENKLDSTRESSTGWTTSGNAKQLALSLFTVQNWVS